MKLALTIGVALLLAGGCSHSYQPETAELAGKPGIPAALNQTDEIVRATKLMHTAEADSGYAKCLLSQATPGLEGAPLTYSDDGAIEYAASYAERQCTPEFDRFTASLRANAAAYNYNPSQDADSQIKASIRAELVKAMRHGLGLSEEPSKLFPPAGQPRPL